MEPLNPLIFEIRTFARMDWNHTPKIGKPTTAQLKHIRKLKKIAKQSKRKNRY